MKQISYRSFSEINPSKHLQLIRLFVKRIKEDEERISMKRAKTEAKENMEKCKTEGNNNEDETVGSNSILTKLFRSYCLDF